MEARTGYKMRAGYKQTDVGVIPDAWEVEPIGNCVSISVAGDLKEEHYSTFQTDQFQYPVFSNTVANNGLYGFYDFPEYTGESLTLVGRGVGIGTAFKRAVVTVQSDGCLCWSRTGAPIRVS